MRAISTLIGATLSPNSERRYTSQFELLDAVSRRLGFRLYNKHLQWHADDDYLRTWNELRPGEQTVKDRRFVVYSMARSLENLPGDTAECGVFEGASSFLICRATEDAGRARPHHVFDSFQGLSEPGARDCPSDRLAFRWRKHDLCSPLDTVQRNLARFDFVHYYPGWIPERFAEVANRRFSFVHVDVDLYQPTMDSLQFFYDRMVPGGILLCDDYGFTTCPGARCAFDEFVASRPERSVIHLSTGQGFIVKQTAEHAAA